MSLRFTSGWTFLVLLFSLAVLFSACSRGGPPDGQAAAEETTTAEGESESEEEEEKDSIPVEIARLEYGPMEAIIKASANLEAEDQVMVVSEATRRVQELLVEEGDRVRKGQLLLRLQDAEQRAQLERSESQLNRAQREFDRQQNLHNQGLATDQAASDATYDLEQAKVNFADAEREFSYTQIKAPISGTVTQRMIKVGDQVQLGQNVFELIDFESLVARVFIPEKNLKQLAVDQNARVYARALSDDKYDGNVLRISPIVDARSGTVKVTVAVGGQSGLRPGLYVDVELITAVNPSALRLPKRALIYDNDQIFAFRVAGTEAQRVRVIPRLADKTFVEPLQGFSAGDSVVVAGQASLKNGAKVEVVDPDAIAETAATQEL